MRRTACRWMGTAVGTTSPTISRTETALSWCVAGGPSVFAGVRACGMGAWVAPTGEEGRAWLRFVSHMCRLLTCSSPARCHALLKQPRMQKWQQQGSGDIDDLDDTDLSGKGHAAPKGTGASATASAPVTPFGPGTAPGAAAAAGPGATGGPSPALKALNSQGSMPGQTCGDPTALDQPASFAASSLASPLPQHMHSARPSCGGTIGGGGSARASCNGLAAVPSALSAATASNVLLSMSPSMDLGSPTGAAAAAAGARRRDSTHLFADQHGAHSGTASPAPSHNGFFSTPLQESQQQSGAPGAPINAASVPAQAFDWQTCFADVKSNLKGPLHTVVGMRPDSARRSSTGTLSTPPPPPALTVPGSMNGRRSATGMLSSPRPSTVVPTGALTASGVASPVGGRPSIAGGPQSTGPGALPAPSPLQPVAAVVAHQATAADAHDEVIPFCEFSAAGLVPVE